MPLSKLDIREIPTINEQIDFLFRLLGDLKSGNSNISKNDVFMVENIITTMLAVKTTTLAESKLNAANKTAVRQTPLSKNPSESTTNPSTTHPDESSKGPTIL